MYMTAVILAIGIAVPFILYLSTKDKIQDWKNQTTMLLKNPSKQYRKDTIYETIYNRNERKTLYRKTNVRAESENKR